MATAPQFIPPLPVTPGDAAAALVGVAVAGHVPPVAAGPTLVRQLELSDGGADLLVPHRLRASPYRSLQLLVRLHRRPLGVLHVALQGDRVENDALRRAIWGELGASIHQHLRADGVPRPEEIPFATLDSWTDAPCRFESVLEHAPVPRISVVIPTCNRPSTLLPCVRTILDSSWSPLEVIVVENRPHLSATAEALQQAFAGDQRVRYLEEPVAGTSRARNAGLRAAQGDVIAFVDDDVLVDRHWLGHLLLAFVECPAAASVTGLILPLELETPAQIWLEQYGGFSKGFERIVFDSATRRRDPLFPYTAGRFGSGANMAMRRDVALQLGGFDPALGGGTVARSGEDLDLFLRLMLQGGTLVYEPAAMLWHRHHTAVPQLRKLLWNYGRGLGAVLSKQLIAGGRRRDFLGRIPAGVRYLLDPASTKNARRRDDYPRQLALLELLGMATGPVAYLRSRGRSHP